MKGGGGGRCEEVRRKPVSSYGVSFTGGKDLRGKRKKKWRTRRRESSCVPKEKSVFLIKKADARSGIRRAVHTSQVKFSVPRGKYILPERPFSGIKATFRRATTLHNHRTRSAAIDNSTKTHSPGETWHGKS